MVLAIRRSIPFLVLAVILLYTYALFELRPYLGFYYTYRDIVAAVFTEGGGLAEGDRILAVDGLPFADYIASFADPNFRNPAPGDALELELDTAAGRRLISWTVPADRGPERISRLFSTWWLPFVFWLSGALTWTLMRPRSSTWGALFAFQMLIALYLADLNGPFLGGLLFSVPLARLLGCLSLPVFLHLHWLFPQPVAPLPRVVPIAAYTGFALLGLGTAAGVLPPATSIACSVLAVAGSLALLGWKLFQRTANRANTGFLLGMFIATLLPAFTTTIGYEYSNLHLDYFALTGSYYPMAALPSAYFLVLLQSSARGLRRELSRVRFVFGTLVLLSSLMTLAVFRNLAQTVNGLESNAPAFMLGTLSVFSFSVALIPLLDGIRITRRLNRPDLYVSGDLQLRANRLLTPYLFLFLFGSAAVAVILLLQTFTLTQTNLLWSNLLTALAVAILTLVLYPFFQRRLERNLFGTQGEAEELVEMHARRITTTQNLSDLADLLTRDVLPGFLVRGSALLFLDEHGQVRTLYAPDGMPSAGALFEGVAGALSSREGAGPAAGPVFAETLSGLTPDWIRVVLPLRISSRLTGLWLLGACDPDDEYSIEALSLLQTIANQTALALSNILHTAKLHAVYRADIDRHELERGQIARDLHDDVLNQLISLALQLPASDGDRLLEAHAQMTRALQRVILRLRPAVLGYGLEHAFRELAGRLSERKPELQVQLDLRGDKPRYPEEAETHIYRIVQQVCENVLRHAAANNLSITGELGVGRIDLVVADDGAGFVFDPKRRAELIGEGHFGLVGLFERAELIGAMLLIESAPGKGTRVHLRWDLAEKSNPTEI